MESWARRTAHFSPDSRTVVLINPRRLTIWNTETAKQRSTIEQAGVGAIAFSPDSRVLAGATGSKSGDAVVLWNASTLADWRNFPAAPATLFFAGQSKSRRRRRWRSSDAVERRDSAGKSEDQTDAD